MLGYIVYCVFIILAFLILSQIEIESRDEETADKKANGTNSIALDELCTVAAATEEGSAECNKIFIDT